MNGCPTESKANTLFQDFDALLERYAEERTTLYESSLAESVFDLINKDRIAFDRWLRSPDYIAARNTLVEMWLLSLRILRQVSNETSKAVDNAARLVATQMQPRNLAIALYAPNVPTAVRNGLRDLLEAAARGGAEYWRAEDVPSNTGWDRRRYVTAVDILARVIRKQPLIVASLLEELHVWVASPDRVAEDFSTAKAVNGDIIRVRKLIVPYPK